MINDTQMDSGEKLQWECKAMGRPRPTYRWLRNGLPLTSQVPALRHNTLAFLILPRNIWIIPFKLHNHCIYSIIPSKISLFTYDSFVFFFLLQGRVEIVNGEVTIHKVQQTDSGMYQCIGENKYGAIYSNAELKILGSGTFGLWFNFDKTWH